MGLSTERHYTENPQITRSALGLRSSLAKILAIGLFLSPVSAYTNEKSIDSAGGAQAPSQPANGQNRLPPDAPTPTTPPSDLKSPPKDEAPGCFQDHIFDSSRGEYRYTTRCV